MRSHADATYITGGGRPIASSKKVGFHRHEHNVVCTPRKQPCGETDSNGSIKEP